MCETGRCRSVRWRTLGLLVLVACSGSDPTDLPEHLRLARSFQPAVGQELGGLEWHGQAVTVSTDEDGAARYTAEIPAESWRELGEGAFRTSRPFGGMGTGQGAGLTGRGVSHRQQALPLARHHLELAFQEHEPNDDVLRFLSGVDKRPAFILAGPFVYLLLDAESNPSRALKLSEALGLGHEQNQAWRVDLGAYSTEGLPLLPGQSLDLSLELHPGSQLRFHTVAVGEQKQGAVFRVRVDGTVLFEYEHGFTTTPKPESQVVELGDRSGMATVTLEVMGQHAGFTAFLKPVLCPPGSKDASGAGKDVVLLLADTFRADNLKSWGGDPLLCPNLNDLATESLCFTSTRAPATWTLPSQGAMFAGLYPPQISVATFKDRLPPSVWTLAEHFQAAGYRTVAITDGVFVGRSFGFEQGFEWFEEADVDMDRTIASVRATLGQDDGRPLFLFVQSYRAHEQYRVTQATQDRLGERYRLDRPVRELEKGIAAVYKDLPRGTRLQGEDADLFAAYERWYRGACADLDEGFGALLDLFKSAKVYQEGVVAFTSDHGESFGEHGVFGHGRGVWVEEDFVPLVVHADGLQPGHNTVSASLVDLPRTLTQLAGIASHESWGGQDLSEVVPTVPLVSYQSRPWQKQLDVAVVEGGYKWVLRANDLKVLHLYHVEEDPLELVDLWPLNAASPVDSDRARHLAARARFNQLKTMLRQLDEPIFGGVRANATAADLGKIEAAGYGGKDE